MNPIRQVIEDAPDFFSIPQELRHRKVEIILWSLDEASVQAAPQPSDYERTQVDRIEIPSREERNARRSLRCCSVHMPKFRDIDSPS